MSAADIKQTKSFKIRRKKSLGCSICTKSFNLPRNKSLEYSGPDIFILQDVVIYYQKRKPTSVSIRMTSFLYRQGWQLTAGFYKVWKLVNKKPDGPEMALSQLENISIVIAINTSPFARQRYKPHLQYYTPKVTESAYDMKEDLFGNNRRNNFFAIWILGCRKLVQTNKNSPSFLKIYSTRILKSPKWEISPVQTDFIYQKFPPLRALKFDSLCPDVFLFWIRASFRELKLFMMKLVAGGQSCHQMIFFIFVDFYFIFHEFKSLGGRIAHQ